MNNKYDRLSAGERITIHVMHKSGKGICEIARMAGRSKGTISKELRRHRHDHCRTWYNMSGYEQARFAEQKSKRNAKRRGRKRKLANAELMAFVLFNLSDSHWSPEAISEKSKSANLGETVSTKTIYNWIKKERRDCLLYLRQRGVPRRQRVSHRRGKFRAGAPSKRSSHDRPMEVFEKREIGHFEVDTVVSCKGGKGGVLALRERVTRQRQYAIIADLKAETVLPVLRAMLLQWPCKYRKTATFDNGSEFSSTEMTKLESFFPGLKIYYTDPYAAWQKGSVENSNGEVRWYYPKGTDFSKVSKDEIRNNVAKINRKPMKCNGWSSSQEMFDKLVA